MRKKNQIHIVNDMTAPPDQQLSQKPATPSVLLREKENNNKQNTLQNK